MKAIERNGLNIFKSDKHIPEEYFKANNDYTWYKTNIFKAIAQKEIRDQIEIGNQSTLTDYTDTSNIYTTINNNMPVMGKSKSIQSVFTHGGELFMEQNPDLSDVDVQSKPEDATVKATVKGWRTGTVQELWNVDEDSDLNGIEMDDQRIQIDLEVEYDGNTFEETIDYPFYESPSGNTKLGQFLERYDLEEGLELTVNYDSDQNLKNVVGVTN